VNQGHIPQARYAQQEGWILVAVVSMGRMNNTSVLAEITVENDVRFPISQAHNSNGESLAAIGEGDHLERTVSLAGATNSGVQVLQSVVCLEPERAVG
jgi:hypothetical protein